MKPKDEPAAAAAPRRDVVPDLERLVAEVLRRATNASSFLHGPAHWKCAARTGLLLARREAGADKSVIFLFGLLHDSMRLDDGADRDHGRRAGALAVEICGNAFHLEPQRLRLLRVACDGHADGRITADVTVGICWDADRLNLCRLGISPRVALLSTAAGRDPVEIRRAEALEGQHLTWAQIWNDTE